MLIAVWMAYLEHELKESFTVCNLVNVLIMAYISVKYTVMFCGYGPLYLGLLCELPYDLNVQICLS